MPSSSLAGPTSGLLHGIGIGEDLLAAEVADAAARQEALAASAGVMELGQLEKDGTARESALKKKADRRAVEAQRKADEASAALWKR